MPSNNNKPKNGKKSCSDDLNYDLPERLRSDNYAFI